MSDKLREIVQIKIGEASMCWKSIPKDVFDSDRALKVADELITQIKAHYESLLPEKYPIEYKNHKCWNDAIQEMKEKIK